MTALPTGLKPGTYAIDPSHSTAAFIVRHAGISKVRGSIAVTEGSITIGDDVESSTVSATLDAASVDTGSKQRDEHLVSPDFWDAAKNPTWTFVTTSVVANGDGFDITGDLTLNGVTKPVTLATEYTGTAQDPFGNVRVGFEATTQFSRKEFDLTWNAALETGGVLVSDNVKIELDVSAIAA
ncbi:YceI family protein [Rarobacter incanus]|uniref:Polyisoprenoid-binding protein YceI n=1 Tax=Rarobacter incanus TaxID=153494 RepID=A0A542SQR9_9MICO|nr:YceI family protein [Rarobacter incanus]TQK76945.1 polyisoprenoid-binding protein YceI [Rarobacter incanus]